MEKIHKMHTLSTSVTREYFIYFAAFVFSFGLCVKYLIANVRKIKSVFVANTDLTFLQNTGKTFASMFGVLFTVAGIVVTVCFLQMYLKDLKSVINSDYVEMTATIELVNPEGGEIGGRVIVFKNTETGEILKIRAQSTEPPDKDGTYTVYYLPNTKIGRWVYQPSP